MLRSLHRDKRGIIAAEMIFAIGYRILAVAISFLVVWFFVGLYFSREVDVGELEGRIVMARLLYSDCFNIIDENGRIYPGLIDANKLNVANVKRCVGDENMGYKLKLISSGNVQEFTANEELFKLGREVCKAKKQEKFWCGTSDEYVFVNSNNERKSGVLNMEVVVGVK